MANRKGRLRTLVRRALVRRTLVRLLILLLVSPFLGAQEPAPGEGDFFIEQTREGRRFIQRLSWPKDPAVFRYEVLLEEARGTGYRELQRKSTEENFLQVSLGPGKYRYRLGVYTFLNRLAYTTEWIPFEVLRALQPSIRSFSPQEFFPDDEGPLHLTISGRNISAEAETMLRPPGGAGQGIRPQSRELTRNTLRLTFNRQELAPGSYEVYIKNPGGLEDSRGTFTVHPERPPATAAATAPPAAGEPPRQEAQQQDLEEQRLEQERRRLEEQRLEQERRRLEEQRLEQERRRLEEQRLEQERRRLEEQRLEEERRRLEERRQEQERLRQKFRQQLEQERAWQEWQQQEEQRLAEERQRQQQEEQARQELERRRLEERRLEQERQRLEEQRRLEERRLERERKAIARTHRPDFTVSAGYAPLLPLYGALFLDEAFSSPFYPPGAAIRAGVLPLKRDWGYVGAELGVSWFKLKDEKAAYTVSAQAPGGRASLLYQLWLPKRTMALNFRLGLGLVSLSRFLFDYGAASDPPKSGLYLSLDTGISFQWHIKGPFFTEAGLDFTQVLSSGDSSPPGYLRPTASLGWQF